MVRPAAYVGIALLMIGAVFVVAAGVGYGLFLLAGGTGAAAIAVGLAGFVIAGYVLASVVALVVASAFGLTSIRRSNNLFDH